MVYGVAVIEEVIKSRHMIPTRGGAIETLMMSKDVIEVASKKPRMGVEVGCGKLREILPKFLLRGLIRTGIDSGKDLVGERV